MSRPIPRLKVSSLKGRQHLQRLMKLPWSGRPKRLLAKKSLPSRW